MSAVATGRPSIAAPDDRAEIGIAAPPEQVWRLVSDIGNMPRWSPETFRTEWVRGARSAAVGARFRGWNRWRWVRWSTTCEVEACEPGREFTFSTQFGPRAGTRWRYLFEDNGQGGTLLTETRTSLFQPLHARLAYLTVLRGHSASYPAAMATTLRRIKQAAEQPG